MKIAVLSDHLEMKRYMQEDCFEYIKDIDELKNHFQVLIVDVSYIDEVIKVNRCYPEIDVIYVGEKFTSEIYNSKHVFFMFYKEMDLYLQNVLNRLRYHDSILEVSWNRSVCKVMQRDIQYIERNVRISIIHTGKKEYYTSKKLIELLEMLSGQFVLCHHSYIVNMDCIAYVDKNEIILYDDTVLPVSRNYAKAFRKSYNKYREKR